MSFFNANFVNIIQVNQPFVAGPLVTTTLTNAVSGPAFTERQFLEALKYRKSLPPLPPPRKLTLAEVAELQLQRAQSDVWSLPTSFYGHNDLIVAEAARDNLKRARENRDFIVNKARADEIKARAVRDAKDNIRRLVKDAITKIRH